MIVWYSDVFKETFSDKITALINKQESKSTTDILYHSLLDLIDAKMDYDIQKSIFSLQN